MQYLMVLAMFLDRTIVEVLGSSREAVSMSEVLLHRVVLNLVLTKVSE